MLHAAHGRLVVKLLHSDNKIMSVLQFLPALSLLWSVGSTESKSTEDALIGNFLGYTNCRNIF